ncbi:leucine-rich repeat flightless-interacting protein 2-like, partial [Clarias magur]
NSAPMTVSSSDPNLKFLEASLAEAQRRNEQAMEKITQLDVTNNFLLSKLVAVQQELSERGIKCKELLRVSLAEAERKYSEAMESMAQLENEKTELMSQVNTLRGSVQHLEEELSEIRTRCDILKDSLAEAQRRNEQAMEKITQLERKNYNLMSKVNTLQNELSLTRLKWKDQIGACDQESGAYKILSEPLVEPQRYEQAMEKITQLEKRNTFLASKLITLHLNFSETQMKWKEQIRENKREQEARARLESQCKEVEESLRQRLKACDQESAAYNILKVSLAEAERKCSEAMESRAQLENEKTELMSQVNTLRGSVQHLEEELSEIRVKCAAVEACDQESEAYKVLRVFLAEAERKCSEAMESRAQLENEKTELMSQVNTLRGSVQQLQEELSEIRGKCATVEEPLVEPQRNEPEMEKTAQLQQANAFLTSKLITLQLEISETRVKWKEQIKETEQQREARAQLESQCKEVEETLQQRLKDLLSQAEVKHNEAMLSNARLESEKSDLMSMVGELEVSTQEMSSKLSEMHDKCVKATMECKQKDQELRLQGYRLTLAQSNYEEEHQAHNKLRSQYNQMKEKHEDLLKALEQKQLCLAEAERKYNKVRECSAELQEENRYLLSVVDALRRSKTLRKRHSETCMQIGQETSLAETEMLYKQVIKSSVILDKERHGLKWHVHTLRDTVKELEEMHAHAEKKCEAMKEERDQVCEVHRILKIRHNILQDRLTQCSQLLR